MSKYVKDLLTKDISSKLDGVEEAVLVNVIGLTANQSVALRKDLRAKDIKLVVVKNSLAKRATEGTPLAIAFENCEGTLAVMWGAEDIITLAKEATRFNDDGFQKYVLHLIQKECPAHIYPNIYWLDFSNMEKFEVLFKNWLNFKTNLILKTCQVH